jgi:hypothetical protein
MKAIERFYQYLDHKGIKPTRFEKVNGLSNGYLGTQLKRNGNLGEDILNKIIDNCLDLDPNWLLTGKGNMIISVPYSENLDEKSHFLNESFEPVQKLKTDKVIQNQSVPLFDAKSSESLITLFQDDNTEIPIDHVTIPNLAKCDGAIYVSSDTMYPILKPGDIIIYKKVANTIENVYWGEMYLVYLLNEDGDEFVMVRRIQKSEKADDFIQLVSENKNHEPKDFHINSIKGLALIKASIRINSMH